ncbi:MAG: efflux RND transporter periplasmic adaptor subunit [Gammaproteobacteria bacterium]
MPPRIQGIARIVPLLLVGGFFSQPATTLAQESGAQQAFAMPVEVAEVRVAPLERRLEAVGTLRANEAVAIRPEVDGRVVEILFQEGERVAGGDVLVRLDDSIYRAELEQAEARLELSKANSKRVASLRAKGLSSSQEVDQAQSELAVNHAAVNLARARLEKMVIRAPFSGVVGLRNVSVGDYVSRGQDIVNLLDLDPVKVRFRVPEIHLNEVRAGQALTLSVDAFPGERFRGEVYAIDPQVDINGRSLLLQATVPNPDLKLRSGLFARVSLIVSKNPAAILIPEEAVIPQGRAKFVYKVVEGKAVRTEIATGSRLEGDIEVIRGLAQGDRVITAGQMKVQDGMPVQPIPVQGG